MNNPTKCQAKNPATCRIHGTNQQVPQTTPPQKQPKPQPPTIQQLLTPGTVLHQMFHLFTQLNETIKTDLCETDKITTIENPDTLTTGHSYTCPKCEKTHFFKTETYDKTIGGKALTYMFRQLPDQHRNTQFLTPLMSLQMAAMDESFTHHYKNEDTKGVAKTKIRNKIDAATHTKVYDAITIPPATHTDWTSYPGSHTKLEGLKYIEPEQIPKEILYKFSQCLRKTQHNTPEQAQKVMTQNKQQNKEVYNCPHCKKYHYGTPINPNRTEQERHDFAKKTWALPAYRKAVNLVIETYKLQQTPKTT